jgi:hypothetical protein
MGKSMIKRAILALVLMAAATCANAAGTISGISMTQQLDQYGKPLSGGLLYLIQAGTTSTPQNCYKDTALTLPWPNPVVLDAFGRTPQLFCADGQIKIRLTDKLGNAILSQDNILVIGPSSGGGGGGTVDPTTIAATGDVKAAYGTGTLTGWVRMNGRTVGSSTSGATERANADTQALFQYLWVTDANLAVSGGRGVSAAADWAANKTIALPDARGRGISGLDDMGNTAAGTLTLTYAGCTPTTVGSRCGNQSHTQTVAEMASHNHGVSDPGHVHSFTAVQNSAGGLVSGGTGSPLNPAASNTASAFTGIGIQSNGGGNPMSVLSPNILMTIYLKL